MASSSKKHYIEDEEEEQVERFDDFTLASSWERFISEIESVCRQWLANGPKRLVEKDAIHLGLSKNFYKVKTELKYAMKSYCMEYYFESRNDGKIADWSSTLHDLQLSFGVKEFLVIAPQSASGVVLDSPEASKLLSAVAIALSNCSSLWPAFVPVHDPSRKAYIGIQNMGTVFTRRFEADHLGSQVPVKLMHLEGLYELFVSKFITYYIYLSSSPKGTNLVVLNEYLRGQFTAFSTLDLSTHIFKVHFTMKLTYRTIPYDDDEELQESDIEFTEAGGTGGEIRSKIQWDEDCPWSEWYSAEDPVKGFKLITIWEEKTVESSLEMAELENASLHEAEKWFIFPEISPNFDGSKGTVVGFASQLRLLVKASVLASEAQFMEDFVSVESSGSDNMKSSAVIPPPTVLDRVLKELFHEVAAGVQFFSTEGEHKSSRNIKGAPLESLFAQFCLHSLWFGDCNIRAIAVLWIEFVREVRWCWEESQPLPRMPAGGVIDLSTCLVNQKLHMLAICIKKKRQLDHKREDGVTKKESNPSHIEEEDLGQGNSSHLPRATEAFVDERDSPWTSGGLHGSGTSSPGYESCDSMSDDDVSSADSRPSDHRRGSAGVVRSMMLLKSRQYMHAPFTQDPPVMTEDMHEERLQAVEALGDLCSFSAQLEREILLSDMSAFKAANPDAVFEDFIRWHSPKDWENDTDEEGGVSKSAFGDVQNNWPPRGRLSERMSEGGNSWRKIWNDAPALPVSEQKPLLDPNREGEKALHYLETLKPHLLLEQMVCAGFRAAADTLAKTSFGGLKQMTTKMGQLYLTIASALKPIQASQLSKDSEITEDLGRLCVVFENVEKLLTLAASLHRKFIQAPRLSESIFNDFYNFYIPNWGKASVGDDVHKEFDKRQEVREYERDVVTSMFAQPSANQSWRKVLSMGNLLNGHEPVLREIVFSTRDTMNSSYYAANNPWGRQQEIETYRMYICGTSNDLRVALSVTSCD